MKIVSLLASSTEIVCALGLRDKMVGRSHECDFPSSVESLPACSEPKINIHASAIDIDKQVKDVVRESLSVYNVHKDQLKALNPDVIVTQDHCEVCAVSLKDVEKAVCDWVDSRPTIVSLKPEKLDDIYSNIQQVAEATASEDVANKLISEMKEKIDAIAQKAQSIEETPTVACIEWMEPLMAAGNWVPELVELAGAKDLIGQPQKHSPWMSWDQLKEANPDVIMIMPCGWDIKRTQEEMHVLLNLEGWSDLKAVRNNKVFLTDGNQYFNRPGPRMVESLEIMVEILYPSGFDFGHHGKGWICHS